MGTEGELVLGPKDKLRSITGNGIQYSSRPNRFISFDFFTCYVYMFLNYTSLVNYPRKLYYFEVPTPDHVVIANDRLFTRRGAAKCLRNYTETDAVCSTKCLLWISCFLGNSVE